MQPTVILIIGPPGVGKTAIQEGLASRIVSKEVPESLHNKRVLSIDLSAITARSGIRGQFEEKFKALLRNIKEESGKAVANQSYTPEVTPILRAEKYALPCGVDKEETG